MKEKELTYIRVEQINLKENQSYVVLFDSVQVLYEGIGFQLSR